MAEERSNGESANFIISPPEVFDQIAVIHNLINLSIYRRGKAGSGGERQNLAEIEVEPGRLSETAVWVVWQHASWIPLQRLD